MAILGQSIRPAIFKDLLRKGKFTRYLLRLAEKDELYFENFKTKIYIFVICFSLPDIIYEYHFGYIKGLLIVFLQNQRKWP